MKFSVKEKVLIFTAAAAAWLPMLFVPFLNDDYQILMYFRPESVTDILRPLWESNIWGFYWRPLAGVYYSVILFITGMNPVVFHFFSLFFYTLTVYYTGVAALRIGFPRRAAFISAVLFALLPAHSIVTGWIVDILEVFTALFLLLAFINTALYLQQKENKKYAVLSILFFTAALLSKELAYAGLSLPPLVYILLGQNKHQKKRMFFLFASYAGVFILVLLFRLFIVGSDPLAADHLASPSVTSMLKNLLLYIPVSFLPPSYLEKFYYAFSDAAILIAGGITLLAVAAVIIWALIKDFTRHRLLIAAGVLWFFAFIIPALPVFMKWYCFTASIGLVWIIGLAAHKIYASLRNPLPLKIFFVLAVMLMLSVDTSQSLNWIKAGTKMNRMVLNIKENRTMIASDTIYVWGVPDKYKTVPLAKLGFEQTFEYAAGGIDLEVLSPLRSEIYYDESSANVTDISDSSFTIMLGGGRFLPQLGRSRAVVIEENIRFVYENYSVEIITWLENGSPFSEATVSFPPENKNLFHLFYDGRDLRKVYSKSRGY